MTLPQKSCCSSWWLDPAAATAPAALSPFYLSTLNMFAARRIIGTPVSCAGPLRRRGRLLHTRSLLPPHPPLPRSPRSLSLTPEHTLVPVPSVFLSRCSPALLSSCPPPLWTSTPTLNPASCTCPNRARWPLTPAPRTRPPPPVYIKPPLVLPRHDPCYPNFSPHAPPPWACNPERGLRAHR